MINHLHQIALGLLFVSYSTYGHSSYNTDGGSCYEQVATCPCSKDLWMKKSQNTTCPQFKRYACVLHGDGILVEICTANFTIPFGRTGCPYVKSCNDKGEAEFGMPSKYEKCPESITGCPNQSHPEYSIYEMYLYPACYITDRTVLKNQNNVTSCTKKERMNTPETPSKIQDILSVMIGIVVVLFVIVGVILAAVCCERKRRCKGFDEDKEDQSQTLQQPEEEKRFDEDEEDQSQTLQQPEEENSSDEDITNGTDQNQIGEMNRTKNERPHTPETPSVGQNNLLIRMFISAIVRFSLQVYRICYMASASVSIWFFEQCKEDGKDIKARTQCYECHEILFESSYHLRLKISKHHHLIEIVQSMSKSTSKYDPSTSKQTSISVNDVKLASDFLETVTLTEIALYHVAQVALETTSATLKSGNPRPSKQAEPRCLDTTICLEFIGKRPEDEKKEWVTGVMCESGYAVDVDDGNRELKLFDRNGENLSSTDSMHSAWERFRRMPMIRRRRDVCFRLNIFDVDATFKRSSSLNVCFDWWKIKKSHPCKVKLEMALQIKIEDVCSEVRHDDIQYPELYETKPVLRPLQTKTLM